MTLEPIMPRKPTTRKPTTRRTRSKRRPTSLRLLSWLDRAMSNAISHGQLSDSLRELGFSSFDKSVVSKINKGERGLSADEVYAISALTKTEIPHPLTAYELAAMRKESRRAAGKEPEQARAQVAGPITTQEWIKSPDHIVVTEVKHGDIALAQKVYESEDGESDTRLAESDEEFEMDVNAERKMKSLVCAALAAFGRLDKDDVQALYGTLQVLARRKPSASESLTDDENSMKEVLGLMTALGLQPPK